MSKGSKGTRSVQNSEEDNIPPPSQIRKAVSDCDALFSSSKLSKLYSLDTKSDEQNSSKSTKSVKQG